MGEQKPLDPFALGKQLTDIVQEKVERVFVDAIDEEQWKALVVKSIQKFTQPKASRDRFNADKVEPSELEVLVHEHVRAKLSGWIAEKMNDPEWNSAWNGVKVEPGHFVKEIIRQLLPEIVVAQYGSVIGELTNTIKHNLDAMKDSNGL